MNASITPLSLRFKIKFQANDNPLPQGGKLRSTKDQSDERFETLPAGVQTFTGGVFPIPPGGAQIHYQVRTHEGNRLFELFPILSFATTPPTVRFLGHGLQSNQANSLGSIPNDYKWKVVTDKHMENGQEIITLELVQVPASTPVSPPSNQLASAKNYAIFPFVGPAEEEDTIIIPTPPE